MASSLLAPEDITLPPSPPEYADEYAKEPSTTNGNCTPPSTKGATTDTPSLNDGTTPTIVDSTDLSILPPLPPTLNIFPKQYSSLGGIHLRSRSLASSPSAPCMARAHSSPGPDSRGRYGFSGGSPGRPSSPQDSFVRRQSFLRLSVEESFHPTIGTLNVSETIAEHPELQTTPRSTRIQLNVPPASPLSPGIHNTLPRSGRRRPSSPLHPGSVQRVIPLLTFSSTSSLSSTPSTIRSRSPSISSLENIPDAPDAEVAAIEADRIAKLKAAADKAAAAAANNKDFNRRRSAIEVSGPSSPVGNPRFGLGSFGGGRADKRKRWSVCGAEGRQDLDLETIWED
ncbi:uncharacterized protein PADG_04577 [Paracoccidioides brasiliensis Pb18]|uniref:Basic proline-rich protein n=1 Tax=Paracoccidioides brasiliensis (strain Pb18) TaxID=502780 RepID=C1GC55_PARBD|nr:uncharacterized protein PADG_04577 [Paracoccidioides brasiliensis Pb18]EEH48498.2 hypothetical protein PADG_04577 [Paracoccidioides brasiliensis Pb18]